MFSKVAKLFRKDKVTLDIVPCYESTRNSEGVTLRVYCAPDSPTPPQWDSDVKFVGLEPIKKSKKRAVSAPLSSVL